MEKIVDTSNVLTQMYFETGSVPVDYMFPKRFGREVVYYPETVLVDGKVWVLKDKDCINARYEVKK